MKTHKQIIQKWMQDPKFKKAYDDLKEEFTLFDQLLQARYSAGLTQEDVAKRMGTKAPAIARIEASGKTNKHSPSLSTLQRYAQAVGCKLEIKLVPQ